MIQRLDGVEIQRLTWQRCIDVENRLFNVATKYQRRYNIESTSWASGVVINQQELFNSFFKIFYPQLMILVMEPFDYW